MGLPDRDSASTWGGKLLVDRDGAEIGTCTQIFLDDATGQPEWAQADLSGGPGVVPLMDAAPAGDRVRVAVRRSEVEDAPRVDDPLHISQDEEERLYRHYGITFSREDSESLLPVDGPVAAESALAEPTVAEATPAEPTVAEPALAGPTLAEPTPAAPVLAEPVVPAPTEATSPSTGDLTDSVESQRRGLLPALAAGAVGVLAVIAAAVFWWRRQHQLPPTRKELLAERARAASLALAAKKEQLGASAAPLVLTGRRFSAAAAQSAAPLVLTGRRVSAAAAQQAAVQARVAAERAAVQARAAAQQAAAVAAAARTVRLQRVPQEADIEPQSVAGTTDRRQRRDAVMTALEAFGGFAAGYAVRARTGRAGSERPEQEGSQGRGQQVQRIAGRVQTRVTDTVRAGNAQLSQRGSALVGRVRRGSTSDHETP